MDSIVDNFGLAGKALCGAGPRVGAISQPRRRIFDYLETVIPSSPAVNSPLPASTASAPTSTPAASKPRRTLDGKTNRKCPNAAANSTDCFASSAVACGLSLLAWRASFASRRT
jgi:hypothetical protein